MNANSFKYLVIFLGTVMFYNCTLLSAENTFTEEYKECQVPGEEERSGASETEMDEFMHETSDLLGFIVSTSGLHLYFKDDLFDHIFEPQSPPPERSINHFSYTLFSPGTLAWPFQFNN